MNKNELHSIVVVRQHDQLGDMLCVVPMLRALRQHCPKASITLVASPVNYQIMLNHPYADTVLNYHKREFFPGIQNLWGFIRTLRSANHDLAVVPATVSISTTSNAIALLSGAPVRVGPGTLHGRKNSTSFCFTDLVNLDWADRPREHQTLRNLEVLRGLGITTEDLTCPIGFTSGEIHKAQSTLRQLKSHHPLLLGIHPGAGKAANRWPAAKFAELVNRLAKTYHAGVIITAGQMDRDPLREVRGHLQCEYTVVENEPIRNVAALINELDLFITNDTGIMHVAGGTSAQTLSLFGPTDPLQWAPPGKKNRFIVARDGDMNSVTVDEVHDIASLIIQQLQRN